MGRTPPNLMSREEAYRRVAALAVHGSERAAARALGLNRNVYIRSLRTAEKHFSIKPKLKAATAPSPRADEATVQIEAAGRIHATQTIKRPLPTNDGVHRYLLTCAQNDTKLHENFWRNLLVFAEAIGAEIHVSRFAYVKTGIGEGSDKAGWTQQNAGARKQNRTWDAALAPYLSDERMGVAPSLVWCGEMNILPTAGRPLSGLDSYTGRASGIFPHAKLAMDSLATAAGEPAKFNYTTGAVTQRNYIQRKAGLMAEFHHCYGALLVEVDAAGDWFARQINADSDGNFFDLDMHVCDGAVTRGNRAEAITWGDIHVAEGVAWVDSLAFAEGGMLDTLRPRYQFLHDVLHFRGRSHHEIKNPHTMFLRYVKGQADIRAEVDEVGHFLNQARRPWCESVIVDSNHHHHMARWLQEQDGRNDPLNALFWLAMQMRVYQAIQAGEHVNYLAEALREVGACAPDIDRFLSDDESFILCPDAGGGIEAGMHGDRGPNGSRGSAKNLSKLGRKANIGHSHSTCIVDGIYQGGTNGELHPDWVHGPGSWSHSMIVTYPNGKRAIITMISGKWRAA